jgi:hypothetical protein
MGYLGYPNRVSFIRYLLKQLLFLKKGKFMEKIYKRCACNEAAIDDIRTILMKKKLVQENYNGR